MTDKDCPLCKNERWVSIVDRQEYTEARAAQVLAAKQLVFMRLRFVPCPECQPDGWYVKNKKGDMVLKAGNFLDALISAQNYPQYERLLHTHFYCWLRMHRPQMMTEIYSEGRYGLDERKIDKTVTDSYLVMTEEEKRRAANPVKAAVHTIPKEYSHGSERQAELERNAKQLKFMPDDDVPF